MGRVGSKKKLSDETAASSPTDTTQSLTDLCLAFNQTIKRLRAPDGCPWDREQTFQSLRPFLIEECYEAIAACDKLIDGKVGSHLEYCDELGDVLLQVFLNASIAEEQGLFTINDVFDAINTKMIRRHPHVFNRDTSNAKTVGEVLTQWADIKQTENSSDKPKTAPSLLEKATKKRVLPTLAYGCEISKRSLAVGFSWMELKDIFRDLESEVRELSQEIFVESPDLAKISDEAGDVVYALCNVITFLREKRGASDKLDLDLSARAAFNKFATRFCEMEKMMEERGEPLTEERARTLNLDEWNDLWVAAKRRLAKKPGA
jgi:tetrapyrrole methylase family protein/MazG family protein